MADVSARAERLREAVSEKLGEAEGRYRDLDALMTSDELLRAIVSELGITREMVEDDHCDGLDYGAACFSCQRGRVLSTLLEAAGVQ